MLQRGATPLHPQDPANTHRSTVDLRYFFFPSANVPQVVAFLLVVRFVITLEISCGAAVPSWGFVVRWAQVSSLEGPGYFAARIFNLVWLMEWSFEPFDCGKLEGLCCKRAFGRDVE